jgi:uncharacterized protein YkwD
MTRHRILGVCGLAAVLGVVLVVGSLTARTSSASTTRGTTTTSTTVAPTTTATAYDQYALELVNSIRANPQAAANTWLAGDLNEGLSPGTISTAADQPLAFNADLESAAQQHNNDMLNNGYFSHTGSDSTSPFQRITAAGYTYQSAGENIAAVSDSSGGMTAAVTEQLIQNLFVDSGVTGRGHRVNLLTPGFQAAGISNGYVTAWSPFSGMASAVTTQDFGSNGSRPMLTGVAYSGGSFYAPGSGLSGVKVKVTTTSGTTTKTVGSVLTTSTGGFVVAVPANGCYTLSFVHSGTTVTTKVKVGTTNVEVDYTPTAIVAPGSGIGTDSTFNATC